MAVPPADVALSAMPSVKQSRMIVQHCFGAADRLESGKAVFCDGRGIQVETASRTVCGISGQYGFGGGTGLDEPVFPVRDEIRSLHIIFSENINVMAASGLVGDSEITVP